MDICCLSGVQLFLYIIKVGKQLTDNFRLSEFVCKFGCGAYHIGLLLVALVQTIRTLFGKTKASRHRIAKTMEIDTPLNDEERK